MKITDRTIIGELVAQNYLTAEVFRIHNIDFCCHGNRSIEEACRENNITSEQVLKELRDVLKSNGKQDVDYPSWPLDVLADYIEKKHHRYVEEQIPVIKQYLTKICDVHGFKHPELYEVNLVFNRAMDELVLHMKKEELILFPYIRKIVAANHTKTKIPLPAFGSIQNPIQMMQHEHSEEGGYFQRISELTNQYTPPVDGCNTYKGTFSLLKEFEQDLHLHIHLENNILFPKSVEMESQLV